MKDMPPAAGHNNPPADDPIDAALAEYGDVIAEAEGWLDGVKVESDGQMRAVVRALLSAIASGQRAGRDGP